jgi:hypothetical protein
MNRTNIFKKFKSILDNDKNKINLKQQLFLENYVEKYNDNIDRLLIYHGIGTGKTRTSIIIAEKIMKLNPKMKAIIILPARLKTNYIDELIPLICLKYEENIKKYYNPKTDEKEKKQLKLYFDNIIKKNYSIYSYEYIVNLFKKSKNINLTLEEFTKNKILIVDEFHNLISNKIQETKLIKIYKNNKILENSKNVRALIMRYISRYADKSCKMFFLTATPIYDNYQQFIELVKLLNINPIKNNLKSLKQYVPYIQNKISYYVNGDDDKDNFPKIEYEPQNVQLSKTQDIKTFNIQNKNSNSDNETFLLKQRQIAISVYSYKKVDLVLKNLDEYAPKLKQLFNIIMDKKESGKHLIYSNFINYCLYFIKKYLDNNGWINYIDKNKRKEYEPYKTYILWDASLSDNDKMEVKSILNSKENMDGKIIKVILGSPSIKEGVSFKHIQHLHQIDPVWNSSAKEQIEGRCIRYKSHEDIPLNHKYLKRRVIIHNYISVPFKGGKVKETCDEYIYNKIIPKKKAFVDKITQILQKSAIDYYLYRKLSTSPKSSSILNSDNDLFLDINENNNKIIKKIKCPKIRRPINNKCNDEYYLKLNKHKEECCYKIRTKKMI